MKEAICSTCGEKKPVVIEDLTAKKSWCSLKCSLEKKGK